MTDPIADMLSRIRNAAVVNKTEVNLSYSAQKQGVASILAKNGFLKEVKISQQNSRKVLNIVISDQDAGSTINEITRLSRPGRRQYVQSKEIPIIKRGRGIVVISTSKGVMSGEDAKRQKLGGELICKVY